MVCPICGKDMADGMTICPNCGFNYANQLKVSPDKVIAGQSEAQHIAEGDDSVTQLIPENYMNQGGDDSVTQLIPENYMSNQGDDSVTQLIPENNMGTYMPEINSTPKFQPVNQNAGYYPNANVAKAPKSNSKAAAIIIGVTTAIVVGCIVLILLF